MKTLGGVSARVRALFKAHYEQREPDRYKVLIGIFNEIADYVEASQPGTKVVIDHSALAEATRSYFFDTIRYKEYHFDPEADAENFKELVEKYQLSSSDISEIDPLSATWSHLVHESANINASKVAAYTVKWLLRYKPISVLSDSTDIARRKQSGVVTNINEVYALNCALSELQLSTEDISSKKIDELIYCFRFRPFDESSYFMVLSRDYLVGQRTG